MKRYLIFGGYGFIGMHLLRELRVQSPQDHIAVVDIGENPQVAQQYDIHSIHRDFSAIDDFDELLQGVDTVIHLISTTSPAEGTGDVEKDMEQTVGPTLRLLEALTRYPHVQLLFLSSGGTVYGNPGRIAVAESLPLNPICTYGVQKVLLEKYMEVYNYQHGLDYRIVRLSNPYGIDRNTQKTQGIIPIFIRRIWQGSPISIWGENTVRDYLYIEDAVKAIWKIADYAGPRRIFNVGSGAGFSIRQVLNMIEEKIGKKAIVQYKEKRLCDVEYNVLDISLAAKELGWRPQVFLSEGIDMMLQYL